MRTGAGRIPVLFALATVSDYIKDVNCVPDNDLFSQLVSSMTTAINSQAKASFGCGLFAAEEARDLGVSFTKCDARGCEACASLYTFFILSVRRGRHL